MLVVARRALSAVPQLIGVSFLTFLIVRLLPADPAVSILGPYATPEGIARITERYGLDKSIPSQYLDYMQRVFQGDLGTSWVTSTSVASDLARRLPATLELTSLSLIIAAAIAIPLGSRVAAGGGRRWRRIANGYGLLAGALPEFWIGVVLVYLLYVKWQVPGIAAPSGQYDVGLGTPIKITGMVAVDSLVVGDWEMLRSSLGHLILPVTTLVIVLVGPILKVTMATTSAVYRSDYIWYMRAAGYPERVIRRRAMRNALPVVATLGATLYAYLLGGAVLVEKIFSWGGGGQYALDAVQHADLMAIQGFVVVAAAFTVLVYLVFDVILAALDPRASGGSR
ncbi:MAG: peptide/nickel transport system permease protein [Solirubrobacteraceae bacterium]|nr:peptide/nickel transport system permease protein [Solirubrobacteraceae bacterium]